VHENSLYCHRRQKLAFLRRIDLFALPTIYRDPKGLPVLEALASGTPVILPNHGAFPELVAAAGGGLLHEPENAADLAAKLAELLRDKTRRLELGRQGQTAVHTYFSAERMATETVQLYRQVATRMKV
jgi:glycosyltransferase involved in cell wall biosynthesis